MNQIIDTVKDEVVNEVKKIETAVESVVETVAKDIYEGAKTFEQVIENEANRVKVILASDEKLALRELEVEFLKAKDAMQTAAKTIEETQKKFQDNVNALVQKYLVNPAEWSFDLVTFEFNKIVKAVEAEAAKV